MTTKRPRRARRTARAGTAVSAFLTLVLAGCGSGSVAPADASGSSAAASPAVRSPSSGTPSAGPATGGQQPLRVDTAHIHVAIREPATGNLLLATHDGLYRVTASGPQRVGPVVDLMGFAIAPDGSYYASGHPGPGTDLPQPLGLVHSTDRGQTWRVLGRGGESDFHALTVSADRIAGFDGRLRTSPDGRTWTTVETPAPPHVLDVAPGTGDLLATTEAGLQVSQDGGTTWRRLTPPELVVLAAWADDRTIVGVTTQAQVVASRDGGDSWQITAQGVGRVTSLSASVDASGAVEMVMVRDGEVLSSTDLGRTLVPAR